MGEVKDAVKGTAKPKPKTGNLIDQVQELRDEVSRLTAIKDDDALNEGAASLAENTRKAAQLRAVHSLLTSAQVLLEEY